MRCESEYSSITLYSSIYNCKKIPCGAAYGRGHRPSSSSAAPSGPILLPRGRSLFLVTSLRSDQELRRWLRGLQTRKIMTEPKNGVAPRHLDLASLGNRVPCRWRRTRMHPPISRFRRPVAGGAKRLGHREPTSQNEKHVVGAYQWPPLLQTDRNLFEEVAFTAADKEESTQSGASSFQQSTNKLRA